MPFYYGKDKMWKGDNEMQLQKARQMSYSACISVRDAITKQYVSIHTVKLLFAFWKYVALAIRKCNINRIYYEV